MSAKDFLQQPVLAVAGVSRDGTGYGNRVWKHLRAKGIRVYPLNPHATEIDGEPVYASLRDLPEPVGGVITVVPPQATVQVVRDCLEVGVPRVWMQPGSESEEAIRLAQDGGMDVVAHRCILTV